ncbi:MAG: mRNA surveillance protein pelota [Candidatus Nanohaloarchaea archaeon]|nr:mRNA surveillance protein pelota [Candidatus Nanohaloarchaea archaeon]
MKILGQDRKEGYMKLEVESDSDLWHLRHVVEEGDVLKAEDRRTTIEGGEKKYSTLKLEVEKTSYEGGRLRATGEITEAPEDVQRGYHTFNIEKGFTFEIWKDDWKEHQLERVRKASETEDYEVVVCMIDSEGANFSLVTETGIKDLSEVESGISGKMYPEDRSEEEFYGDVISVLKEYRDADRIIVAGPGFEKENLVDRIEEDELKDNVVTEDASTTGRAGVQEVLKRGAVKRVLEESRVSEEVEAVEDFLEVLNTEDEKAVYGLERVREAADVGAVARLLVTDPMLRDNEDLVEEVERKNGEVQIVHTDHDAGKKLDSLGGVAAVLRYEIPDPT